MSKLKRILIGKPLKNKELKGEKFGVLWGLPILSSDAISSVAYAGQEVLLVLIPAIGVLAYGQLTVISGAIIGLLILLMLSYRQTIENYPNGGGAYIVAKENLGIFAGVTAGAALSVDYILTVAVSVSSGVEQITSAFLPLRPYTVPICVVMVLLLMLGNLRGIRESSRIFGIPAYAFIFAILSMLVAGFIKVQNGYVPPEPQMSASGSYSFMFLLVVMLKAFASGCTALTGVEAISNAVPNFKSPSTKYAKLVLLLLSLIILLLFGGTSVLANIYHVDPTKGGAMLILMAEEIFDRTFMFYFITATTFIILIMAANTAYSGFPLLVAVMAKEGYVPRQLSMRGDRLSYSNGIIFLSIVSILLIILFKAKVTSLLGLYAIGVFISFTLSQSGMFKKWLDHKGKKWLPKAVLNGFGALVTGIVVIIIAIVKFHEGAWVVVVLIPILIYLMLKVKKHYTAVKLQLKIKPEDFNVETETYKNRVICPIQSINKASLRALKYAKTISDNVVALCIATDEEEGKEMKEKYEAYNTGIPLIVKYSPYRKVVDPLIRFIESEEYEYNRGDMITVMLAQFNVKRWWHVFLHNQTKVFIERELLKHKHIVVAVMPLQLKDDDVILKKYKE